MIDRLWVVERQFRDGSWGIYESTSAPFVSVNYYTAHRYKRELQKYLGRRASSWWTKRRFRVREYVGLT